MTPLKLDKREAHRLERNLGAPSGPNMRDEALVSLLHRMFWSNFAAITGKAYSLHEIHHDARVKLMRDNFVRTFLPELQRKTKGRKP